LETAKRMENKVCTKCKEEKPVTDFYKRSDVKVGVASICKKCDNTRSKEWKDNNKEKTKMYLATTRYGITQEQFKNLKTFCAICGSTENLCIDHSHKTGEIRGRLCMMCNRGLGFFMDNPTLLNKAADYINGLIEVKENGNDR
jgi:hypothetical protein